MIEHEEIGQPDIDPADLPGPPQRFKLPWTVQNWHLVFFGNFKDVSPGPVRGIRVRKGRVEKLQVESEV